MHQSGRLLTGCSTALTVGAVLGIAWLSVRLDPFWSGPAGGSVPVADLAEASPPGPGSDPAAAPPDHAETHPETANGAGQAETAGADASSPGPSGESVPPPVPQWTEREVAAALMECVHLLAPLSAEVVPLAPIRNGACGAPAPVLLRSIGGKDKVVVDPPLLINCPMIVALDRWLEKIVQPAAKANLGSPVARITGSSYACRNRYNLPNDRLSQHAFADAIDLPLFVLADGRRVDLASGWGPTGRDLQAAAKAKLVPIVAKEPPPDTAAKTAPAVKDDAKAKLEGAGLTVAVKASASEEAIAVKASAAEGPDHGTPLPKPAAPAPDPLAASQAKFLHRVHQGACQTFSTVLGPEANDVHRTHLHLDLQDRNGLNVCQ